VFIDVRKRRLDFLMPAALAEASEAACASTTSAKRCFYEHDYGPREHPRPPNVVGTTARSIESRLSIAGNRRSYAGPGVEKPNLDTHHRDCSRRGLRPNPDRFGHLVSRAPSFALSGETRGRERVRRHRACLHRKRNERVVRRPTSAKKSDVHQPEGPSVERAVPKDGGEFSNSLDCPIDLPAPFSPPGPARETLVQGSGSSAFDKTED
jgi:hypothetical protein